MRKAFVYLLLMVLSGGCGFNQTYNPLGASSRQIFLLNESSFAQITVGMRQEQVHKIMGESIIIGYASQNQPDLSKISAAEGTGHYKPLTIANPYKTEDIKTKDGGYTVEYYVNSVRAPDGVISNDELTPLVFREGVVVAKGWDYLKALRSKNPS